MYSIELTVVIVRWNNSATKEGRSQCPTTDNAAAKIPQKKEDCINYMAFGAVESLLVAITVAERLSAR